MNRSHFFAVLIALSVGVTAGIYADRACAKKTEIGRYVFLTTPGAVVRCDSATGEAWVFNSKEGAWVKFSAERTLAP